VKQRIHPLTSRSTPPPPPPVAILAAAVARGADGVWRPAPVAVVHLTAWPAGAAYVDDPGGALREAATPAAAAAPPGCAGVGEGDAAPPDAARLDLLLYLAESRVGAAVAASTPGGGLSGPLQRTLSVYVATHLLCLRGGAGVAGGRPRARRR